MCSHSKCRSSFSLNMQICGVFVHVIVIVAQGVYVALARMEQKYFGGSLKHY